MSDGTATRQAFRGEGSSYRENKKAEYISRYKRTGARAPLTESDLGITDEDLGITPQQKTAKVIDALEDQIEKQGLGKKLTGKGKDYIKGKAKAVVVKFILANPWVWVAILIVIVIIFIILFAYKQLTDDSSFVGQICGTLGSDQCIKLMLDKGGEAVQNSSI